MSNDFNPCEWLPSYLVEELTPQQKVMFEAHLPQCQACKEEFEELKQVWEELPYTMKLIEPPSELKGEVMDAVFGETIKVNKAAASPDWSYNRGSSYSRIRRWGLVSAAALVIVAGSLAVWNWRTATPAVPNNVALEPAKLQQEYLLRAFDPGNPNGKGNVWMTQQGSGLQVVLHVSGLLPTKGEEAYQMWMVKAGKRYNCGTFQVDQTGNGVLVYPLKRPVEFDTIGITLEPDANGTQPRGKKVLGT
jgi:hypothetical protein